MKTLKQLRREYIRTVLENSGWDIKKASSILKISEKAIEREAKTLQARPLKGKRTTHTDGTGGRNK